MTTPLLSIKRPLASLLGAPTESDVRRYDLLRALQVPDPPEPSGVRPGFARLDVDEAH